MNQLQNTTWESSNEDIINELRPLDNIDIIRWYLCKLSVEKLLDLLNFLSDKNEEKYYFAKIFQNLLYRDYGLIKTYLMDNFPWLKIESIIFNDTCFSIEIKYAWTTHFMFKDISISKLKILNEQLKLWWFSSDKVANTLSIINDSVINIQEIWNKVNSTEKWMNQIALESLDGLSKKLSWVQFQIDQIDAMSYSDLGDLWKQRWWKLFQKNNNKDVSIIDSEWKIVQVWRKGNLRDQFTCIVSTDEETIATSVWLSAELWYVDNTKWKELITWDSDWMYINPAMSQLASSILKQWFSWKLEHIWNGYFQIGILHTRFFDNKWNLLNDKNGISEFVFLWKASYEFINWKVVVSNESGEN
jgi:hypothetical protein